MNSFILFFLCFGLVIVVFELWQFHEGLRTDSLKKQMHWHLFALPGLLLIANAIDELHLGSFLAVFSLFISIVIYLKQDTQTQKFEKFQKDALESLHKGSQDAFDVLVAMRNDDLRKLSEDSELDSQYWKHKWVFESFEHVTLTTDTGLQFSVKVLGTMLDFKKEKLMKTAENLYEPTHYICQVDDAGQTKPDDYEQQDASLLDYFWDREEWKRRQSPLSEPLWTGRTIAVAFIFGETKLYAFSSINKGEITPKAPHLDKGIPIKSFWGGKSWGGQTPFYIIDKMEKDVHYFNRIADHKVSQSQGDAL
ncbi:MAG: hypothetical protein ACKO43_05125 [Alphaproteobacteria bacterium]